MTPTPEDTFNNNLKRRYAITPEDYWIMYQDQRGHCAICDEEKSLVVDHDHDSGEVRGLLCQNCNLGIGQLRDSLLLLCQAIKYLINPPFNSKNH